MTKIKEIIDISSGYTSYVDLIAEYTDSGKNQERMRRYRPITAHRLAFEKIANALNPRDRRFYFLSGSYGTGKSHLLLMLANYFAEPSDLPEMEIFFERYTQSQASVLLRPGEILKERSAASLKAARNEGRYLLAFGNFGWNLEFEGAIIRAVEEAFVREGTTLQLDSYYLEALRRLADWQARKAEAPFYNRFEEALIYHPGWTMDGLTQGLKDRKETAIEVFKSCFTEATDNEFRYSKDNLEEILKDILNSADFKTHFKGIIILYDEFGYALDNDLVNLSRLHNFAQFCANSGMQHLPIIFIGSGHKSFRNHGQVSDAVHYSTLEARVSEISLQTQGMEDIISAIVHPLKEKPNWVNEVAPQSSIFTWFSSECKRLGLFNWLPAPQIRNNIIENIYPMHPLATFAVLRLAEEAGSDNRSVFMFFSPEFETGESGWKNVQEYSYPWFIERSPILEDGKLLLYTADWLVDYFQEGLQPDNRKLIDRIKTSIKNYEATLRGLNEYLAKESEGKLFEEKDELMLRIIKIILIHEVISKEDTTIPNTLQNITFSLNAISDQEKIQIENRLNALCKAGILYNDQGIYELMPGDIQDIQRLIDQYKANPDNRPSNLMGAFLELNPLRADESFLEAKDYNLTYNEDKRLKVVFATPAILETNSLINSKETDYFTGIEEQRQAAGIGKDGYEGTAVYAFCEQEGDLERTRKLMAKNNQDRVVVAIPKRHISIFNEIFTLRALDYIKKSKEHEIFGPLELAKIKEIRDDAVESLDEAKNTYFSNDHVHWYGQNGANILVNEAKRHDVANIIMSKIFTSRRNTFPHKEFNRSHTRVSGQVLSILREAGDILLDLSQTVRINWSWPPNRGGTLYLRQCFVDNQVLRILHSEGEIRFFKAEEDVKKFTDKLPAYAQMLEDMAALEGRGSTSFQDFIQPYFEEYGQGEIAVCLMLLMARRYYGDGLRFKREKDALTDLRFDNTDDVLKLVNSEIPNAVLLFEPVSKEDRAYFAKVYQVFSAVTGAADSEYGINDALQAINSWWEALPIIARSESLHANEDKPFIARMSQIKTKDPFNFIKHDLLDLLGITPGEKITKTGLEQIEKHLEVFKATAEGILEKTEDEIRDQMKDIFEATSTLDIDIRDAIRSWYNDTLNSTQQDPYSEFHNNDSKPLILKVKNLINVRELLYQTLPDAYGFDRVENWSTNLVKDYTNKISRGKKHIEENVIQIPKLELKMENVQEHKGTQVTYRGELKIHGDTEDGQGLIYYTDDGSDPAEENSQRQRLFPGQELVIKGNRKIKLVVADQQENYGVVTTIDAINELDKYKIKRPHLPIGDELVNFIFPKDKPSAQITLLSLFEELEKMEWMDIEDLRLMVQEILDKLENQK
jgi:hypothetical protein